MIALFVRSYYRRHVGELPPEEKLGVTETESRSTEVTDTLHDQASSRQYGSLDTSGRNTSGNHSAFSNGRELTVTALTGDGYSIEVVGDMESSSDGSTSSNEIQMQPRITENRSVSVATSTHDLESAFAVNVSKTAQASSHLPRDLTLVDNGAHRAVDCDVEVRADIDSIVVEVTQDSTEA